MGRKYHHYKLLLDENFIPRDRLPRVNRRYDVKHIKHDYGKVGFRDADVYAFAVRENRILVTFNDKDFIDSASRSKKSGVIGVSAHMLADHIDKKLSARLRRAKSSDIYGSFIYISY